MTRKVPLVKDLIYHIFTCPDIFYQNSHDAIFEVPSVCVSHRCLRRFGKSHYIYAEFVSKTFDIVVEKNISPAKPQSDGKIAVLLEPRLHPLYEYTVKQVMSTLGSAWALQLFVSSENEAFVRRTFDVRSGGSGENIIVTRLENFGLDMLGLHGNRIQSALSAHTALYEVIASEHILWFQLDVLMREEPRVEWLEYAYVGSEWNGCQYPTCAQDTCPSVCGGGNSGLSLRRRSKLLRIATRGSVPEELWGAGRVDDFHGYLDPRAHFVSDELHENSVDRWFEDDLQISYKLAVLGLLPPNDVAPRFAISEAVPSVGQCKLPPSGMHKPWAFPWLHPEFIIWLLGHVYSSIVQ